MPKELCEGVRGQIIALRNEGLSERKISAKLKSRKVLCNEQWRDFWKLDPFPQGQDLADQKRQPPQRTNT